MLVLRSCFSTISPVSRRHANRAGRPLRPYQENVNLRLWLSRPQSVKKRVRPRRSLAAPSVTGTRAILLSSRARSHLLLPITNPLQPKLLPRAEPRHRRARSNPDHRSSVRRMLDFLRATMTLKPNHFLNSSILPSLSHTKLKMRKQSMFGVIWSR